ncbi:hypothetical protein CAI21_00945 [Alkalilimnicola ehrlichii]|uniref:Urease accessory protein UreH-like transmembrane domain-containing protein n=2 Tax=Alkalilimnicola ehrlichii TaxID=351052 RepID=A0A3E0X3M1_9GAMM|nr:hypothetical protein CAI21_00945 [Alkalilimnicola ehrlichii]RFA39638.1 hypothetical protein CAL65_01465 [Alkalilimnicola ehrlichii]
MAAAFLLGFLGSTHCLAMCGGISAALMSGSKPGGGLTAKAVAYNLGRISSYTFAGLLAGTVGLWLGSGLDLLGLSLGLRLALGILMLAIGLHLLIDWQGIRRLESIGGRLWQRLAPLARRLLPVRSAWHATALGALWGWLPCGLVYSVLLAAAASGSPLQGALVMLAFGLGTAPAMLAVATGSGLLGRLPRQPLKRLAGGAILLYGTWTLASPIAHLVQPHAHAHSSEATFQCREPSHHDLHQ